MSRTKGTIITGAPYEVNAAAPLDAKSNVGLKSDLFTAATWQAPSSSGANAGKMFCYYGMLVYVGNDTAENNGLYVLKNSGANDANVDALVESNWERISQPDSKIAAIKSNADKVTSKLDKDFVTQSSQGTLGEGTTFAARSDNTPEATNVYITGKQIKDFAAAAVSDKGTFADDAALKAAYPTPEDGWSATVLSTGTTWISTGGQWTDSGKANGVTSVNGKSGNVTLVAAEIDDVLSDTETDQHIQAAFTADRTDLNTTAKSVVGGINEVKAAATKNAGDIAANATAIASKQDSTINLEIQGSTAATVTDALTSLDTALTSVKSTADDAAKKDASNIEAATWKTVLGYQNADEVATAVNNGITTNEYSTLATTAKTVKGAIEELKTAVDSKASSSDFTALQGKVTTLETTVGNAEAGLVKDVADNTAAINAANTNIAKKQNAAINLEGIEAKTVEGALTEIKNATTTNATTISGKADKATTLAGYNISDAYTKTEVDTELGKKQDNLKFYSELGSDEDSSSEATIRAYQVRLNGNYVSVSAGDGLTINGLVSGSAISTSIPASELAFDTKLPSEKAVATAISNINTSLAGKADKATTLAGYNIGDAYTKTEVNTELGKKQDNLKFYSETDTGAKIESLAGNLQVTNSEVSLLSYGVANISGDGGLLLNHNNDINIKLDPTGIKINGAVSGTAISTSIPASESAVDTKLPSEKAVATAIESVKAVASTAYKYKGSDTYANIIVKENPAVGDVWNSTTANGVYPKGTNYAWNGTEWDALGGEVDLSAYQVKAITVGETSTTVEAAINANKTAIDNHVAKQDNPHNVTAAQVGLDKVDNTADSEKPVSTAQQAALDLKQDKTDNTLATTSKTVVGAINEVKGVADAAAKADASNITVATWKEKLGFITADEQVQPDWNATSGKGQILNKPDIEPVSEGSSNALNIGKNSSIDTLNIKIGNGTEGGKVNITTSSMSMYENDNTTSDITLKASCTNTGEGDKEHTGKLVVGAGVNIDGGIDGVNVNSLAINKAILVVGDNTIPLATAGKIVCKSGANVTEFVVNGESVVKEILSGSDIFSISDYADGSYTLASTATGNAIIMNI